MRQNLRTNAKQPLVVTNRARLRLVAVGRSVSDEARLIGEGTSGVSPDRRRILLVSSSGGVLLDLLALEPWWSRYEVRWAVVRATDTETRLVDQDVVWVREASASRPLDLLPALFAARRILRRGFPDLVVSAGSGAAIPFFLLARWYRIPTFWLSTLNVLTTPGIAARVCSRLASRVLLQQESLLEAHPQGVVIGELY